MKLDQITNKKETLDGVNLNDEFYTPCYAIEPLLKYIKPDSEIWCPFDEERSNFVQMLRGAGHRVTYSHIESGSDFFMTPPPKNAEYILSNPPYSLKFEVFDRLFSLGVPFAMLVGIVGLFESQKRFQMFKENDFEIMYMNKRVSYFRNYDDQKPDLNPPFSSAYIGKNIFPDRIIFESIDKIGKKD